MILGREGKIQQTIMDYLMGSKLPYYKIDTPIHVYIYISVYVYTVDGFVFASQPSLQHQDILNIHNMLIDDGKY